MYAIQELFLNVEHKFCMKYLYENFKWKFKNKHLRELFWGLVGATNMQDYERAMRLLERANPKVSESITTTECLKKIPPKL